MTSTYTSSRLSQPRGTQTREKTTRAQRVVQMWKQSSTAVKSGTLGLALVVSALTLGLHEHTAANAPGELFPYRLTPIQVREVSQALIMENIDNTVNAQNDNVLVAPDRVSKLRLQLSLRGLPHPDNSQGELKSFPTANEAKLAALHALENELVLSIRQIDGVQNANLNIAETEADFSGNATSSASVFLNLNPGQTISPEQGAGIAHLVAAAVPNLSDDHVIIVDNTGHTIAHKSAENSDLGSIQIELQKSLDTYLAGKAQTALDQTYGPNRASVFVNAQFDFSQVEVKRTDVGKPGQGETVVFEQKTDENYDKTDTDVDGKPKYQKLCEAKRIKADESFSWTVNKTPRISRLTCSVSISEPHQEAKARALVAGAIGFDASRGDEINAVTVPRALSNAPHVSAYAAPVAPVQSQPWWLLLLGLPGVALIALFAVRRNAITAMETRQSPTKSGATLCDLTYSARGQTTQTDLTQTHGQARLEDLVRDRSTAVANHLRTLFQDPN